METEENKKALGKSQIYSDESSKYGMHLESKRKKQPAAEKNIEKNVDSRRRRELENEQKIKVLSGILTVLVVLLIAAIFYEIILGHGIKDSGNERMAQQADAVIEILHNDEAVTAEDSADKDAVQEAADVTADENMEAETELA